jgi:hypothetical protein
MHTSITLHLPLATDAAVRLVNDPAFIRHKAAEAGSGVLSVDVTVGTDGSYTSGRPRRGPSPPRVPTAAASGPSRSRSPVRPCG